MKLTDVTKKELQELCKRLDLFYTEPQTEEKAKRIILEIKVNWGE